MFVAQAHSFAQQSRLAITLAWVAGYTNIIAVLTCGHAIAFVTGTTSDLGRHAVGGALEPAAFALFLLATFLAGAMLSGFTTELGKRRGWESIYVAPMALEAVLLTVFAIGVEWHEDGTLEAGARLYWMSGVASAAMGLQNATITRISSGVVRTTHVTGVLTDLGMEIVQYLWSLRDRRAARRPGRGGEGVRELLAELRAPAAFWRLLLLASIVGSFALGAGLGTAAYAGFPSWAMFPPVLFLLWIVYQDVRHPIAEITPSELVGEAGLALPAELAVFHLRRDATRRGPVQRMPNLIAWAERLPEGLRVAVLDLGDVTQLDADSATELRAALRLMRSTGRALVLSGLTHWQCEELRRAGMADLLDPASVCPDIDLAIARGLVLLESPRGRGAP